MVVSLSAVSGVCNLLVRMELIQSCFGFISGASVLNKWKFPEELFETIKYHHTPSKVKTDTKLAMIVNIADTICIAENFGIGAICEDIEAEPSAQYLDINKTMLLQIRQKLVETMQDEASLLEP